MKHQIRKLTIGPDVKNGMNYIVGQEVYGGHKITDILEKNGKFEIYIKKGHEQKPWLTISNQNVKVEYNLEY